MECEDRDDGFMGRKGVWTCDGRKEDPGRCVNGGEHVKQMR